MLQLQVRDRRCRTHDGWQVDGSHPGGVGRRPAHHVLRVGHRVVVAQDRGQDLRLFAQVHPATAQVPRCRQRRVVDVLRVRPTVAIAIGGITRPGSRQELHRAQCPGVDHPARGAAGHDDFVPRQGAVQRRPVDRLQHVAAGVGRPAIGVPGLDTSDPGQQVPADPTVGRGDRHLLLGVAVGRQRCRGNPQSPRRIDHGRRWR